MRLAALTRWTLGALLAGAALAQDNSTNSASASSQAASSGASGSASASTSALASNVVVTTITSLSAGPSTTSTATFVLTLTLANNATATASTTANTTTVSPNGAVTTNGTETNGTAGTNSTVGGNTTVVWNDTMSYLPFSPKLDAAYGVGGALLIITGIPVATLGGRNRWSALAIVSGYSFGLFCMVCILSFGVTPALSPPSPVAPSNALRGLYLLATAIATLIGAALGIFFYTFTKYWVGAAGGFAFGWFLLALRKGGLVGQSVGGRWGIVGGLTVIAFLLTLVPKCHETVLLISSAWIGATAFTLGVDCFTRAGLKEFYIYNLGYGTIFPSLNGGKFPLTQNMQVELGVVAAAAIIAAAIQFKILEHLKKRRRHIKEEEEARIEAEQIDKAAENFKNVDAELAEWEGKHGESSPGVLSRGLIPSSTYTLVGSGSGGSGHKEMLASGESPPRNSQLVEPRRLSLLEEMGYADEKNTSASPSTPATPVDPELEQKLMLLAEVRRARQSVRSSMDALRSSATTPSESLSGTAVLERTASPASGIIMHSRNNSATSGRLLDPSSASQHIRSPSGSGSVLLDERLRRDSLGSRQLMAADPVARTSSAGSRPTASTEPLIDRSSMDQRPRSEWDEYVASRTITTAPSAAPVQPRYSVVSESVQRAIAQRHERSTSMYARNPDALTPGHEYGQHLARTFSNEPQVPLSPPARRRSSAHYERERRTSRLMTTDELADRHREMLARMQDRVSGPYKEEQALESAKEQWEKRKREEREEQRRREAERAPKAERGDTAGGGGARVSTSDDRAKRTEDWRRSVTSPPKTTAALPTTPSRGGTGTAGTAAAAAGERDRDRDRRASMAEERRRTSTYASPSKPAAAAVTGTRRSSVSRRPSSGFIA